MVGLARDGSLGTLRILVVRHAEPRISPTADPRQWPLSAAGRNAAKDLRGRLAAIGVWVTREVKAYETLLCARPDGALLIAQDARFDEVQRVEPFDDGFRFGDALGSKVVWTSDTRAGRRRLRLQNASTRRSGTMPRRVRRSSSGRMGWC